MSSPRRPVYLIQMNHFDPIWRRCWDRQFEWNGQTFASYADVEEAVINDWLAIAEDTDATFVIEQTVSLRKYLERNPYELNTLKRLVDAGRLELLASGEIIPDANMPLGESLVRNMLYGILWAEQNLGMKVTIGCRNDGFGSPAQTPQIFRQCEIDWLPFLSYTVPDNDYWQGLDGSCIYVRMPQARAIVGSNVKLRPCHECGGEGCDTCLQRGFDQSGRVEINQWITELGDEPCGVMQLGGEETLPCMKVVEQMRQHNAKAPAGIEYRFGTYANVARALADEIAKVDDPPPGRISSNHDIALSSAGCWVTRIRLNQRNREAEHELLTAETLTTLAWLRGREYPAEVIAENWRELVFTHFHDAITATHVDPAYDELMDMYDAINERSIELTDTAIRNITEPASPRDTERSVAVFNTLSFDRSAMVQIDIDNWTAEWATARDVNGELPVYAVFRDNAGHATIRLLGRDVPALSGKTITLKPAPFPTLPPENDHAAALGVIENEFFRVTANHHGITSILDKRNGRELIDYAHFYPGELILEHDYGDPWATRRPDHYRERMSPFGRRARVTRMGGQSEIRFSGKHPCNFHDFEVNWLIWGQRVVLNDGLPFVEFITGVDWDTHNRRLRMAFPTQFHTDLGDYEVPFGVIRRKRYDVRSYHPNGVNGDWPVTHWAAPAHDEGSVAIINRGECSYRIEGGNVLVSLLRSPTTPWCMYEPEFYRMPLFDGMRDSGLHGFELAFYPFEGDWADSDVVQQAWSYNVPFVAVADQQAGDHAPISLDAKTTMMSAVKKAETGDALIVRLFEYAGRTDNAKLVAPEGFKKASLVNMLERKGSDLAMNGRELSLEMQPFKIVTVRLEK